MVVDDDPRAGPRMLTVALALIVAVWTPACAVTWAVGKLFRIW